MDGWMDGLIINIMLVSREDQANKLNGTACRITDTAKH